MPNPYAIHIDGNDGIGIIDGLATFPDPDNQPGGAQGFEDPNDHGPVTIADDANGSLGWGHNGGDALLDYTDPLAPTVVEAGTYAITVTVLPTAMTADGQFQAALQGPLAEAVAWSPPANAVVASPLVALTLVTPLNAGDSLACLVANKDGAASRDFSLFQALVVKLNSTGRGLS